MSRKTIVLTLLIIFLVQAIQLIIWIKKDDSLPAWDQSWHTMISINKYNQLFNKTDLTTPQIERRYPIFRFVNNYFLPFYHISAIPFYVFFGTNYDSALLTNTLFLLILVLSCYFIGKKLHSHEAGLILAFIISTIPIYSSFMRRYLIDFSLSSMVALGFASLLYSDQFKNLKYSILFGIILGLGMLTKWSYVLFLIVPIGVSIFFVNDLKTRKIFRLRNILVSFLVAFIILGIWYNPANLKIVIPHLARNISGSQSALEGDPVFYSLKGLTYYFFSIIRDYSFIYFMVFLIAVIGLILKYEKEKKSWLLSLINILAIYVMFTIGANKDNRFILPIYVFLATASVIGICSIRNKKIRYSIIVLIVTLGLFQNISYNSEAINVNYKIGKISLYKSKGMYPRRSEVDIDKALATINKSSGGDNFSVCIIAESEALNDCNIPYYSIRENYPVSYMVGNGCNPLKFDYTIVGPIHKTWRSNLFERSKPILNNNLARFKLIYLDDEVRVYKRVQ